MKKDMQEYESLRNEIISLEEQQRNVWLYMYVLFCSLFVLGLQWSHYLFLVAYVVLIPFQCVINYFWWSISRIATYIRLFYEEESEYIKWESFQVNPFYINYVERKNKSLADIIRKSGAVHLAILATGFFCGNILKNAYLNNKFILSVIEICEIIFCVFLLMITIYVSKEYNGKYHNDLEDTMKKYKESIIKENSK